MTRMTLIPTRMPSQPQAILAFAFALYQSRQSRRSSCCIVKISIRTDLGNQLAAVGNQDLGERAVLVVRELVLDHLHYFLTSYYAPEHDVLAAIPQSTNQSNQPINQSIMSVTSDQ